MPGPDQQPPDAPLDGGARSLDDLDPETRHEFTQSALEGLGAVVDACEPMLDEPLQVAARSVIDDRGLVEVELSTYRVADDGTMVPSAATIPTDFSDCMEDTLWERDWYELEPGDRVPFVLSFDVAPEGDPLEP